MAKLALGNPTEIMQKDFFKALIVEFICTFLFVFTAVASVMTTSYDIPVQTLGSGIDCMQGALMEATLTFSLLFTVYGTMLDPGRKIPVGLGPFLVGLVVGANTLAGGTFTGASMNPARSFGPAFVSWDWTNHWVYWVGPLVGGGVSGYVYENFFIDRPSDHVPLPREEESF
ncbi:Major intrinsic protein [Dillenia turbinata]|uniref:Major intrinsic protein n=1 Tax=Dillenia turbinata TaxID=194707 RepID=A0AAN8VDN1_9MAGN